jgi:methylmalonyl-CoA/ethylmalonyl-CoA epimerase
VCVEVDDVEAALAVLKERGVRLVDETPRVGAGGCRVAFVHPKATGGVLLELKQVDAAGAGSGGT